MRTTPVRRCRHLLVGSGLALLGSCRQPRYFIVECNEPPSRSAIAWQITAAHPGSVEGRILDIGSGVPIDQAWNASARLLPADSAWHRPGATGRFRIQGAPGAHELMVRGFGYMPVHAVLTMAPDSGIDVLAGLERRNMEINEICGTRQRR
jgi:hypothetical protein